MPRRAASTGRAHRSRASPASPDDGIDRPLCRRRATARANLDGDVRGRAWIALTPIAETGRGAPAPWPGRVGQSSAAPLPAEAEAATEMDARVRRTSLDAGEQACFADHQTSVVRQSSERHSSIVPSPILGAHCGRSFDRGTAREDCSRPAGSRRDSGRECAPGERIARGRVRDLLDHPGRGGARGAHVPRCRPRNEAWPGGGATPGPSGELCGSPNRKRTPDGLSRPC